MNSMDANLQPILIANGSVQYYSERDNVNVINLLRSMYTTTAINLPNIDRLIQSPKENHSFVIEEYPPLPESYEICDKIRETFLRRGFIATCHLIKQYIQDGSITSALIWAFVSIVIAMSGRVYPNQRIDPIPIPRPLDSIMNESLSNRDWKSQLVRQVVWHPGYTMFAIAKENDAVDIYKVNRFMIQSLEDDVQYDVTGVAFRPSNLTHIAIASQTAIRVWDIDKKMIINLLSMERCGAVLKYKPTRVTSIAWDNTGNFLAITISYCKSLYIWDMKEYPRSSLNRYGYMYPTLALWSASSKYLITNTDSNEIRVWLPIQAWKYESWLLPQGIMNIACWSPRDDLLLYVTASDPSRVYGLWITLDNGDDQKFKSFVVMDLKRNYADFFEDEDDCEILAMAWDKKGMYLALTFKSNDAVALFRTHISRVVHVVPKCLVNGRTDEMPLSISFQNDFRNGANLLVAWSSGRLQYFPAIDIPTERFRGGNPGLFEEDDFSD